MYALVRNDINMSPGKCASQAGHAYLGAFLSSSKLRPDIHAAYASLSPGTKVALQGSLQEIEQLQMRCSDLGLPSYLVIDSGCSNFFDGQPTVTALGIGPVTEEETPKYMRRLKLL